MSVTPARAISRRSSGGWQASRRRSFAPACERRVGIQREQLQRPAHSAEGKAPLRSVTPNTGPYDAGVISDAMSALFARTGPAILFTHSQGGGPGWLTAIKSPNVKAIVAFEPGSGFIFPAGELPPAMPSAAGTLSPESVPLADFAKLTRIPIIIYYGDNFPTEPTTERGQDNWRVRLAMARLWVAAINKHGGDARLVHLPQIGIRGNTHFPMSDLNNIQIADHVSAFLKEKGLSQ